MKKKEFYEIPVVNTLDMETETVFATSEESDIDSFGIEEW